MKILHTSDWHIGKRLVGRERLDEQEAVLDEIAQICETEEIELVIVAGDIFDTYTPSAEAENLFFKKIRKIAGETRAAILISGNHDDGV
ncbi:MAG: exonuclease subunit SbcD, partial [Clostridia bacterium]|nr:exonuclease subunit SbcD [Clostridia bacterium]